MRKTNQRGAWESPPADHVPYGLLPGTPNHWHSLPCPWVPNQRGHPMRCAMWFWMGKVFRRASNWDSNSNQKGAIGHPDTTTHRTKRFLLQFLTQQVRTLGYLQLAGWSPSSWNFSNITIRLLALALATQAGKPHPAVQNDLERSLRVGRVPPQWEQSSHLFPLRPHATCQKTYVLETWKIIKRRVKILACVLLVSNQNSAF